MCKKQWQAATFQITTHSHITITYYHLNIRQGNVSTTACQVLGNSPALPCPLPPVVGVARRFPPKAMPPKPVACPAWSPLPMAERFMVCVCVCGRKEVVPVKLLSRHLLLPGQPCFHPGQPPPPFCPLIIIITFPSALPNPEKPRGEIKPW